MLSVSEYSMSPPGYPSGWLRLAASASISRGKIIVAPPRPSIPTSRIAGNPTRIDGKCGDHFLQAVSGLIRTVESGYPPVTDTTPGRCQEFLSHVAVKRRLLGPRALA